MKKYFKANLILKFAVSLVVIIIPLIVFFVWQENLSFSGKISHDKFGTFGDFFGGIV